MRKLINKIFIYVLLLISIVLGLNIMYIYKNKNGDIGAFANGVPDNIQICNFGSSHGLYGFNYEDVKNYTCFNFALSSQTLLYDYKILMNYKANINHGTTVFILVSYFSFLGKPQVEEENFASINRRYYKILPHNLIEKYDWKTDVYVNYLPVMISCKNLLDIVKISFLPEVKKDAIGKEMNHKDCEKDAQAAYLRHIVTNKINSNGIRIYNQEYFDSLYGMIKLLREIGATPILITTPYTREYTDTIRKHDPKFFGEFYANINDIVKKTGIKYYDYSRDERYINDYSLFRDSDHMNKKGARIFTNNLLKEVLNIFP